MKRTCANKDLYKQGFTRGTVCLQCAEVHRDRNHFSLCLCNCNNFFFCVCSGFSLAVILPTTAWFQRTSGHSETPSRNCRYLFDSSCVSFLPSYVLSASLGFILFATQCQSDPVIFQAFCLNQWASTGGSSNDDDSEKHDRRNMKWKWL